MNYSKFSEWIDDNVCSVEVSPTKFLLHFENENHSDYTNPTELLLFELKVVWSNRSEILLKVKKKNTRCHSESVADKTRNNWRRYIANIIGIKV